MSRNTPIYVISEHNDHLLNTTISALVAERFDSLHVVIRGGQGSGQRIRGVGTTTVVDSGSSPDRLLELLDGFSRKVGSGIVLPVWFEDVAFLSRNRHEISSHRLVPIPEPSLLDRLSDKSKFFDLASSLNLPHPATLAPGMSRSVSTFAAQLGLPIVVKPLIGHSGWGSRLMESMAGLETFLKQEDAHGYILQRYVAGEDVAMTLLADQGDVFAVALRKRWFTRRKANRFGPICDVELFHCDWLEQLGREFVRKTKFSGIADFDLRVDFSRHEASFLECDPRMMAGVTALRLFGVNIPRLLVERTLDSARGCARTTCGHFLSFGSLTEWLMTGAWLKPRRGPLRMNWRTHIRNLWE